MMMTSANKSRMILSTCLLLLSLKRSIGSVSHYTPPDEKNVFTRPGCSTNSEGFYGSFGSETYTVQYFYEVEHVVELAEAPENGIVPNPEFMFAVEKTIADYLLATSAVECEYDDDRRRRRLQRHRGLQPIDAVRGQSAQVVGITVNPPDYLLELACQSHSQDDTYCDVVAGLFTIYSIGPLPPGILIALKERIGAAMNRGDFNSAHPDIIKLNMIQDIPTIAPPESNRNNRVQGGRPVINDDGNTAFVVAATAGALLLILGVAAYRRRSATDHYNTNDNRSASSGYQV